MHELVNGEVAGNRSQETLDSGFVTIDIQQTTNNLWSSNGVDTLNVNLNELGEPILVEVQNEVVDEIEAVADNDEGELVGQFGLLEEVLDLLWVVEVALATDTFDFPNLPRTCRSLDVLEVNLRVFTEIDDGAQIVVETWRIILLGDA